MRRLMRMLRTAPLCAAFLQQLRPRLTKGVAASETNREKSACRTIGDPAAITRHALARFQFVGNE